VAVDANINPTMKNHKAEKIAITSNISSKTKSVSLSIWFYQPAVVPNIQNFIYTDKPIKMQRLWRIEIVTPS
jgi:hypothetical protein